MTSFKKFWPLYLRAHQHRGTRIGHYYATAIALSSEAIEQSRNEVEVRLIDAPWIHLEWIRAVGNAVENDARSNLVEERVEIGIDEKIERAHILRIDPF